MSSRIVLTSLIVTSSIFCRNLLIASDLENKTLSLEKTLQSIIAENAYQQEGVVCAPGVPFLEKESIFFLFDLLYWHARANGTTFCYKAKLPLGINPIEGQTQDIKFGWNLGLRVGGIYNLPHDGWNLTLFYTYFNTNKSNNVDGTVVSPVIPTKSIYLFNKSVQKGNSNAKITMNSIDFLLSRETFLSPYFILSPYAGLKNSWFDFKQNTTFSGGSFLGANSIYVEDKSD
ncbi:MAG: hypothetical protein HY860_00525, partial [Chlamydiales bacterium]|nr:hypothetical protein [Chlamydiales bacterium]